MSLDLLLWNTWTSVTFYSFTEVVMKLSFYWNITLYRYGRFGRAHCLHFHFCQNSLRPIQIFISQKTERKILKSAYLRKMHPGTEGLSDRIMNMICSFKVKGCNTRSTGFWIKNRRQCCKHIHEHLFWHQYRAFFIIYNLTNYCTIISNTIITKNMLLHVSTFKISSSGSSLCLVEITYTFSGLSKIKLLRYKQSTFYWSLSFYISTTLFY